MITDSHWLTTTSWISVVSSCFPISDSDLPQFQLQLRTARNAKHSLACESQECLCVITFHIPSERCAVFTKLCRLLSCVALGEGLRGELCRWRTITSPPCLTDTPHAGSLHRALSCCLTDVNNSPHREQLRPLSCHMSHFILPDSDGTAESSRSQCSAHRHFVFHYSIFFHREYFVLQYTCIAIS